MKTKYRINNKPVENLMVWCKKRNISYGYIKIAIHRAKKKGSNECHPLGFHIIRL